MHLYTVDLDIDNLPDKADKFDGLSANKKRATLNYEKNLILDKILQG